MKTWRMKKALCLLLAAVLMLLILAACGQNNAPASVPTETPAIEVPVVEPEKKSVSGFYMDTIITLTAYTDDEEILNDALKEFPHAGGQ